MRDYFQTAARSRKGLVERFTKREAALAAQISNDIAEGIDNHNTKAELRMAVAYFADVAAVTSWKLAEAKTDLAFEKAVKKIKSLEAAR